MPETATSRGAEGPGDFATVRHDGLHTESFVLDRALRTGDEAIEHGSTRHVTLMRATNTGAIGAHTHGGDAYIAKHSRFTVPHEVALGDRV